MRHYTRRLTVTLCVPHTHSVREVLSWSLLADEGTEGPIGSHTGLKAKTKLQSQVMSRSLNFILRKTTSKSTAYSRNMISSYLRENSVLAWKMVWKGM